MSFWNLLTGLAQEASEGTIEVHGDDPKSFEAMLRFCYDQEYTCAPEDDTNDTMSKITLNILIPLYTVADKYEVKASQAQISQIIAINIDKIWLCDDIFLVVGAYYNICVIPRSELGITLAAHLAKRLLPVHHLARLEEMCARHTPFAADLFIALCRNGQIRPLV